MFRFVLFAVLLAVVAMPGFETVGARSVDVVYGRNLQHTAAGPLTVAVKSLQIEIGKTEDGRTVARSVIVTVQPAVAWRNEMDIRQQAQEAFLEEINHPDRGDDLREVTVRVGQGPAGWLNVSDSYGSYRSYRWTAVGGGVWTITVGD